MGKRGPKPNPTRIHELRGNPSHRPLNANEPRPAPGAPKCPAWLGKVARAEWKRIVKVSPSGLLTQWDLGTMVLYCEAFEEYKELGEQIRSEGRTTTTEKGYVMANPKVIMRKNAAERMLKAGALLGLDPSSRSRLSVPPPEKETDAFEVFLSGDGSKN